MWSGPVSGGLRCPRGVLLPEGRISYFQRVLGSSPRPVLIKINDKKQRRQAKGKEHHPEVRALAEDKRKIDKYKDAEIITALEREEQ